MNPARLIGGWLLLCGLSAGGAYFAMDEADQRLDLAKYDLRAKVGLSAVPSPAPQPTPPGPGPSGGSSQAPSLVPPPQQAPQPGPGGGGSPPPVVKPSQPVPVPQPAGGRSVPGGSTGPTTRPNTPANPAVTPVNPNPIPNNPTGGNPTASGNAGSSQQPTLPPVNPAPAQPKPAISTPDPKSSDDWRQLHDFYTQIGPRADAILRYMEQMRIQTERNRGVFRVDLQTAMNGVRDGLNMAKRALDGGDTDAARSYLTTAYQHLQTLEQARH